MIEEMFDSLRFEWKNLYNVIEELANGKVPIW